MTTSSFPLIFNYQPTGWLPGGWHKNLQDITRHSADHYATTVGVGTGGAARSTQRAIFSAPSSLIRDDF